MNVLTDIKAWLNSSSTGYGQIGAGSTAWVIYTDKKPASTGNMIVLYQYAGMAPTRLSDATIDNPRVQVLLLTAATSDSGYATAHAIQNRLRFVSNQWIPSTTGDYFHSIDPVQGPEKIEDDGIGRMQWVQNFQIKISYS